jgi:hypothetical protein
MEITMVVMELLAIGFVLALVWLLAQRPGGRSPA